jgi:hypothetical protein
MIGEENKSLTRFLDGAAGGRHHCEGMESTEKDFG